MEIPALLIQSLASLVAIFAIFALARWLKLGGKPRMAEAHEAQRIASEVEDGFVAARVSVARKGDAALAADAADRIMVIKRHGNKFSGRILTAQSKVQETVDAITVDCGEARFGTVQLAIEDPAYWVDAINRL